MIYLKVICNVFSGLVAVASYIPYIRSMFFGTSKPHFVTWLVWAVLTGTVFVAQLVDGAGLGAVATGISAGCCLVIAIYAAFQNQVTISYFDKACLLAGVAGIGLWKLTHQPLTAVVIVSIVHVLGFIPTFRKSFRNPFAEELQTYYLTIAKYVLALYALAHYSAITILYPTVLIFDNAVFVLFIYYRRSRDL